MLSFSGIFAVILVLGGLIFFHELGHFLVARVLGIGVSVFSLGFGKRLIGFQKEKTDYRVCLFPLGGYVQLVGETPGAELPEGFTAQESFALRPPWQRMLVVLGGPAFNFLLAWLLFWGIFAYQGVFENPPVIGEVSTGSAAEQAGLRAGDRILKIDEQAIRIWEELVTQTEKNDGAPMQITVLRGKEEHSLAVTPHIQEKKTPFGETVRTPMLGVASSGNLVLRPLGFWQASVEGGKQIVYVSKLMLLGIVKLIERVIPWSDMGGVILISEMIHKEAQTGIINLLALTALISINLGILNLLPIPILDGGHIIFFFLETIAGKPLPLNVQQVALRVGMAFLFTLMIFATINDILRHF